jgi:glycosyltransferase involved in cell wall biosynthesis
MIPHSKQNGAAALPLVSIIVPARNEERSLERCLSSLAEQHGVAYEVIVVDDASMDRTPQIAETFARIRECPVIAPNPDLVRIVAATARPLAPGWSGKVNAMWTGVQLAQGKWLLFSDADTDHKPGSLFAALQEVQEHGAAMLSYSPAQEVHGFWQHALMPVVFAELATTYRPREICDPNSPIAAANGQYLLISREALEAIGGMDSLASELLEDVAIARAVKASGRSIRFRFGGDAVSTRMYRDFESMREGWTKNLALLFSDARSRAVLRYLEFAAMSLFPVTAVVAFFMGATWVAILAAAIAAPT